MTSTSTSSRTTAQKAPVTAYAIPKVAPQRRWRPSLVWLAIALISVGGLIAWRVLATVGSTAEYLAVSQRVEVGAAVQAGDLTKVRITVDPVLKPIKAADASKVVGKYAVVGLTPGTLLTDAQLTAQAVPGPGKQLVGMSLGEDRVPSQRLVPGDSVLLIITDEDGPVINPQAQKPSRSAPQTIKATVVDVRAGVKEGSTLLNVAVPNRDAPMVAARSAAGRIVVSLTTGTDVAIIAMVSAKGSPGVTTTALACTLSWTQPTLLAECDPAGGDLLAGYLGALEIPPMGLLQLAVAELRGTAAEEFPRQVIDLDKKQPGFRRLLPGIADPVQAGTVRATWDRLTDVFAGLEHNDPGHDVIADCGRLSSAATPWPLLHRADLVLLVVNAVSLRSISPAMPAIAQLRKEMTDNGRGPGSLGLLIVGDGPYKSLEIQQRLQLPLFGELPHDRRTAAVLSDGGRLRANGALLRAAASTEAPIRQAVQRRRAHLNTTLENRRV